VGIERDGVDAQFAEQSQTLLVRSEKGAMMGFPDGWI
jgi:hypothetical protein